MTILDTLVHTASAHDTGWTRFIAAYQTQSTSVTCNDWERRGGSHYKNGEFTKK